LTPDLPRSVGLRPGFFPAQRRFGQRPVHRQPVPLDPTQFLKLLDSRVPELEEDAGFHPGLQALMCRRMRTQLGLVQGLPLAAGAQDVEDGLGAGPIGHPWTASAKAMPIDMLRQQGFEHRPQLIRNAESSGGAVLGRTLALALALGWVVILLAHTSSYSRLFG
jgi:hypothetical protein